MVAVVIRGPGAIGLDVEVSLVERQAINRIQFYLLALLDRMTLCEHVLNQLLDHLSGDGRAVPGGPGFFQFA